MTHNIENICFEYADDCMFSYAIDSDGLPIKIIIHVGNKFLPELGKFLNNQGYGNPKIKKAGKFYSTVHFELTKFITLDESDLEGYGRKGL